jgi:hypothetical protein
MKVQNWITGAAIVLCAGAAHADIFVYTTTLSGAAEAPPNASPGTGFATLTYDNVAHTMRLQATFSGLIGTTTAAHIHAATTLPGQGTAGVATQTPSFAGFPLGVTSGVYDNTYDLSLASSFNASFITNNGGTPASAEAALFASVANGTAYLNIHSSTFGGGEIRGFWTPIPGPGVMGLAGIAGLMLTRRRR